MNELKRQIQDLQPITEEMLLKDPLHVPRISVPKRRKRMADLYAEQLSVNTYMTNMFTYADGDSYDMYRLEGVRKNNKNLSAKLLDHYKVNQLSITALNAGVGNGYKWNKIAVHTPNVRIATRPWDIKITPVGFFDKESLENIAQMFEQLREMGDKKVPADISDQIRKNGEFSLCGVYIHTVNDLVYYVGSTQNIQNRLNAFQASGDYKIDRKNGDVRTVHDMWLDTQGNELERATYFMSLPDTIVSGKPFYKFMEENTLNLLFATKHYPKCNTRIER
jgi:GIY-YIG catalytic domain